MLHDRVGADRAHGRNVAETEQDQHLLLLVLKQGQRWHVLSHTGGEVGVASGPRVEVEVEVGTGVGAENKR